MQPPLSDAWMQLILAAFKKLDKTGDGIINLQDIKVCFQAYLERKRAKRKKELTVQ